MHPRNRYSDKPDFGELAEFHSALKPFLIPKSKTAKCTHPTPSQEGLPPGNSPPLKRFSFTLDFSRAEALRELSYAVLARDFNLNVYFPLDKLIPAVPQRLNYIHWLEDLLGLCKGVGVAVCEGSDGVETTACEGSDGVETTACEGSGGVETTACEGSDGVETTACEGSDGVETIACEGSESVKAIQVSSDRVIGIDIGTGASCIYPLLGTRLNGWDFLATDIDKESIVIAQENVSRNGLADKIVVKGVPPDSVLEGVLDPSVPQYNFCMCNPPFFKDSDERLGGMASCSGRRPLAKTFSSASAKESITEGGEVDFVLRIIGDSLSLRNRIRWYTSMLGKKASVKPLLAELRRLDVPVVTTTEFVQGRTWRWGIGWSFDSTLKEKVDAFNADHRKRKERPFLVQFSLPKNFSSKDEMEFARDWLVAQFKELKIRITEESRDPLTRLMCRADKNTWSHQRKRRRLLERLESQRKNQRETTEGIESHSDTCEQKADAEALEAKIMAELEALSAPCPLQFYCSLGSTDDKESSPKKRKLDSKRSEETGLYVEFEWIEGADKDCLHQIVQYLQNKLNK